MANKLKVGDTIKCSSKEEMVSMSKALAREDNITDFLYENDGQKGLWLTVEAVAEVIPSVAEIKQKMCDDYCRYTHTCHISGIENICAECPLNYLEE